jgi:hypothetical protein
LQDAGTQRNLLLEITLSEAVSTEFQFRGVDVSEVGIENP